VLIDVVPDMIKPPNPISSFVMEDRSSWYALGEFADLLSPDLKE